MFKYIFSILLLAPSTVLAANPALEGLNKAASETGLTTDKDPLDVIVDVINVILYFVGAIFMTLIIWSGFKWMTSAGNTDSIKKARETIINSVIGLVIIFASYVIVNFVLENLINIAGIGGGEGPAATVVR